MSDYTVIPLARWYGNGSGKLSGDLVLDGAITQEQVGRLRAALNSGAYFIPSRLSDAYGDAVDDLSGKAVYVYLRDTAEQMHSDREPGWDELTINLVGLGVTVDEFITEMQRIADSPRGWKSDSELRRERKAAKKARRNVAVAAAQEALQGNQPTLIAEALRELLEVLA